MLKQMVWITAGFTLLLAVAVGVKQLSSNDVKDESGDKYHLYPACMTLLRSQVNVEMHASLVYMNMAAHFEQNAVARKGFAKFFSENSKEEREHAQKLIDYLNSRGSKFSDFNIDMPVKVNWGSAFEALNDALHLEKEVYNQLHHIHDIADVHCKDAHLMDFLEKEYFTEQVESIDGLLRHISVLGAMKDNPLGEYLYDRQLMGE
ncbi:ferritin, middle subunit [Parasteatoda tepidariorum]|nr:ferritin, middle subunit [Parasteatoda tepidariorum]